MNWKRIVVAALAVFVFALVWNGIVHGVVLRDANQALLTLRRPEGTNVALGLLMTVGLALLFVWSYARSARRGGPGDGLMHGLFFALLAGLLVDLNQYLLYPIPVTLALSWFGFAVIEFAVYGLLVGWLVPIARPFTAADVTASASD